MAKRSITTSRGLLISGGGTKIAGHAGYLSAFERAGVGFDHVAGVSAGAIISLFALEGSVSENEELFMGFQPRDFWRRSPLGKRGKLSLYAISQIIKGKPYLGDFSNLHKTLTESFTKEQYEALLVNSDETAMVESVDMRTGAIRLKMNQYSCYEDFIEAIVESASIPVFSKAFPMADGGLRNHLPVKAMEYMGAVDELWVLWARPESLKGVLGEDYSPKNILDQLERTIAIQQYEISKNDREKVQLWCKERGVKLVEFFQPVIMRSVYDTDKGRLRELFHRCYGLGANYFPREQMAQF